jgi:AcrR family transcriptional regulator
LIKRTAVRDELSDLPTRETLMIVAERLFGEQGIDAVPLRAVSKEAGQKNTNSVQYHFGGKMELLRAIFEFREMQFNPLRKAMLTQGRASKKDSEVRWLLRALYEPNFLHYRDNDGIAYLKLHAQYLSNLRPRGILHPFDTDSPNAEGLRNAAQLLREHLSFSNESLFMARLESGGAMFLAAMIQHSARPPARRLPIDFLYEDVLEMMTAAFCSKHQSMTGTLFEVRHGM